MRDDNLRDDQIFACDDCEVNTKEINEVMYMLTSKIWEEITGERCLCIGCVEVRLGRRLTSDDFRQCSANLDYTGSERLENRRQGLKRMDPRHFPREIFIEEFLQEMGVSVEILSRQKGLDQFPNCRAIFRRYGQEWEVPLDIYWAPASGAVEELVKSATIGDVRGFPPRFVRQIRGRSARAELVLRQLFGKDEREALQVCFTLPSSDHVFSEHHLQAVIAAKERALQSASIQRERLQVRRIEIGGFG